MCNAAIVRIIIIFDPFHVHWLHALASAVCEIDGVINVKCQPKQKYYVNNALAHRCAYFWISDLIIWNMIGEMKK